MRDKWILIDSDFRKALPKKDCEIWITRVLWTGERFVQKVEFCAEWNDIEYDGTIAWMIAKKGDKEPNPCAEKDIMVIQSVR